MAVNEEVCEAPKTGLINFRVVDKPLAASHKSVYGQPPWSPTTRPGALSTTIVDDMSSWSTGLLNALKFPFATVAADRFRRRASRAPHKFVAFIDVLGFSERLRDWDSAVDFYTMLIKHSRRNHYFWAALWAITNGSQYLAPVEMTIISDSLILTCYDFVKLAKASASLQSNALRVGALLRGCIASGRHSSMSSGKNQFVLSEGLAKAFVGEKAARYPRISIHPEPLGDVEKYMFSAEGEGFRVNLNPDWDLFLQGEDGIWFLNPFKDETVMPASKLHLLRAFDAVPKSAEKVREKLLWLAHLQNYWSVGPRSKYPMVDIYEGDAKRYLKNLQEAYERLPTVEKDIIPTWLYSDELIRFFNLSLSESGKAVLLLSVEYSPFRNTFEENVRSFPDVFAVQGRMMARRG